MKLVGKMQDLLRCNTDEVVTHININFIERQTKIENNVSVSLFIQVRLVYLYHIKKKIIINYN